MSSIRRDPPGSLPTDPNRSTALTPLDELIDHTPTPAQLEARHMRDAHASTRCHYLKPSGERCGSPAMRGFDLCYYHDRYQPKPGYRNLPCLEDPHSVQCAIQEIIEDMLSGLVDYKKAALALYGLQTAVANLKQMRIADQQRREAADEKQMNTMTTQRTQRDAICVARAPSPASSSLDSSCEVHDEVEEIELVAAEVGSEDPAPSSATDDVSGRDDQPSTMSSCLHFPLPTTTDQRPTTPLPTTNDQRPTTLVESPRPPQHVTRGLRTQAERRAMAERFPDMKKIRAEFLASLTPEERAKVEPRME